MKKILLYLILVFVFSSFAFADFISQGEEFYPDDVNFLYTVNQDFTTSNITVNETAVVIGSGAFAGTYDYDYDHLNVSPSTVSKLDNISCLLQINGTGNINISYNWTNLTGSTIKTGSTICAAGSECTVDILGAPLTQTGQQYTCNVFANASWFYWNQTGTDYTTVSSVFSDINITINSPLNNSVNNFGSLLFNYTISGNLTPEAVLECSLYRKNTVLYEFYQDWDKFKCDSGWTGPNCLEIADKNYLTDSSSQSGSFQFGYWNYTVPINNITSLIWDTSVRTGGQLNVSLIGGCFNETLRLRAGSRDTGTFYQTQWDCYNYTTSSWFTLRTTSTNQPGSGFIKEQGLHIFYNISVDNLTPQLINFSNTVTPGLNYLTDNDVIKDDLYYLINCSTDEQSNTSSEVYINSENEISLLDCGVVNPYMYSNEVALNYTLYNTTGVTIPGDISGFFTIFQYDGSNIKQNLTNTSSTSLAKCIYPANAVTTYSTQMEYTAPTYTTKSYFADQDILSNVTQNISLSLDRIDAATSVTFRVIDQDGNIVPDVFINVLKYDLSTNSSTLTEIIKTDSNGEAIGDIILNTQRYKFILVFNSLIILESSDVILTGTTYQFRVNLLRDYFSDYNNVLGTSCLLTLDKTSREFSFTYIDTTQKITSGCFDVRYRTAYSDTSVYSNCTQSVAGSFTYNIPTVNSNATFIATGSVMIDDQTFVCGSPLSYTDDRDYLNYGVDGLFFGFLIVLVLVMATLWNPSVAVALLVLGFVLSVLTGVLFISHTILISFIVAGGIVMYRVSRR